MQEQEQDGPDRIGAEQDGEKRSGGIKRKPCKREYHTRDISALQLDDELALDASAALERPRCLQVLYRLLPLGSADARALALLLAGHTVAD